MFLKKTVSVIMSLALLLPAGGAMPSASAAEENERLPFLKTCGTLIVDENSHPVSLRGTNLGGWLIWEQWMCPFMGADDACGVIEKLTRRFGEEKAELLINTYYDSFISEDDFDRIKALGFNCVRLPFWYRNIETETEGVYDFSRLDYAVDMCAKRGIYVILDCHGLPGFQSIAHHCGKTGDCRLYDRTEEGERFRLRSVKLWQAVAEHYKDNSAVAAYDLMNEPMCDFNELQDDEAMHGVYDLLYKAVRETDGRHIIIMEAIWDFTHLPDPAKKGWQNVMYELHSYDPTNNAYKNIIRNAKKKHYLVPVYEGEFHPSSPEAEWPYILKLFNDSNVSWTTWTYKGYCSWGESDWFIYGTNDPSLCADLDSDSFDEILRKWGDALDTSNFSETAPAETFRQFALQKTQISFFGRAAACFQKFIFSIKLRLFGLFGQ